MQMNRAFGSTLFGDKVYPLEEWGAFGTLHESARKRIGTLREAPTRI